MVDTDIEGLGPKDAYQYVLAFITTLKQTEKALANADQDVATWTRRVELATAKGDATLTAAAQSRLAEATAKKAQLETELADLRATVSVLKEKLKRRIAMAGADPARKLVDADLLLAQLEMVVGPKDELSAAFRHEEANAALEELKRKMGGSGEKKE